MVFVAVAALYDFYLSYSEHRQLLALVTAVDINAPHSYSYFRYRCSNNKLSAIGSTSPDY